MESEKAIAERIMEVAVKRGSEKSTCPSEIARDLFACDWRKHMEDVREVAIGLQQQGKVLITQKGKPVDVKHIKGPVRIKIV